MANIANITGRAGFWLIAAGIVYDLFPQKNKYEDAALFLILAGSFFSLCHITAIKLREATELNALGFFKAKETKVALNQLSHSTHSRNERKFP